jgi:uncharacterized protein (TIGR02466 family)
MIENWFSTPVYFDYINSDTIITQFLDIAKKLKQENKFSIPEDWHSQLITDPTFSENLLEKHQCNEFLHQLEYHISKYLIGIKCDTTCIGSGNYKIISSWFTCNKKNMYSHIHMHGDADLAGVFYFQTNKKDGDLFFENPNKALRSSHCFRHMQQRIYYKPEVGKLILFPGWLEHGVVTNTTDDERLSLSFNIVFER